jgi:hypothetical protein
MSRYYAKVLDGIVKDIMVVAEDSFWDTFIDSSPGTWVEYWKNCDGTPEQKYNAASINHNYDSDAEAFYRIQPFTSWTLNTSTYQWESPVAYPDDGQKYNWNEETQTWDAVTE